MRSGDLRGLAGRRHYLDHASTSPARPEVVEAMLAWLSGEGSADPARVHTEGQMARAAVEQGREQVADLLGVRSRQVVLTSGATESANAAVWGAVRARPGGAIVCPVVEHSCVREASARLARLFPVGVDARGRIDVSDFDAALARAAEAGGPPALAHCQWGNHEVGTLQPVEEIVALGHGHGVAVHVDAAAASGHVPLDLVALGADLVSVSAHKMGGPKGIGALVLGAGFRLEPLILGGDQERGRRAGMENVPAVAGFGAAAASLGPGGRLAAEELTARRLTDRVVSGVATLAGVALLGEPVERLPHIVCFELEGVQAEAVVLGLDQAGIAVHSGSACSSELATPSPVLEAMGVDPAGSLRVSVGWSTTDDDVDALLSALPDVIGRLRSLHG